MNGHEQNERSHSHDFYNCPSPMQISLEFACLETICSCERELKKSRWDSLIWRRWDQQAVTIAICSCVECVCVPICINSPNCKMLSHEIRRPRRPIVQAAHHIRTENRKEQWWNRTATAQTTPTTFHSLFLILWLQIIIWVTHKHFLSSNVPRIRYRIIRDTDSEYRSAFPHTVMGVWL